MSKLDELIQQLCPDGVEWKTIKETVGLNRGKRLVKSQLSDNAIYEVYHGSKDSILGKYTQYNAPANSVIVVNTGGIGGVKFIDKPFWCSDGSFWLGKTDYIDNKYLYYYLSGYENYFNSQKRVGGVPTIDRGVVENFQIPVPPLPIQQEIVRILDAYTELHTELQTELQCRREQYEFYRNKLLSFDGRDDVEWKELGLVASITRGVRVTKNQLHPCSSYPVFQNSLTPLGYFEHYNVLAETPFIIVGGAAGEIGYSKENFWAADDCFTFNSSILNKRYLYYVNWHPFFDTRSFTLSP